MRPDRLFTPREVSTLWHVPRDLVYEALHAGTLKSIRRGSRGTRFLVPGKAVAPWLEQLLEER